MEQFEKFAHEYADINWPVLPLKPREKVPLGSLVQKGLHEATTDHRVIQQWWENRPDSNVGLRTGVEFDAVDIDSWDGIEALNKIRGDRYMSCGPTSNTGKGFHLLHLPSGAGNKAGIVAHVDYRGKNGYIVAPPSVHPNGSTYTWGTDGHEGPDGGYDCPMEALPDWLYELVVPPVSQYVPEAYVDARGTKYGRKALQSEVGAITMAIEGQRNDQLNRSAHSLGQLIPSGALQEGEVISHLLDAALQIGLSEHEALLTIASGLNAGVKSPRKVYA